MIFFKCKYFPFYNIEKIYPLLDELSRKTVADAFGIKNNYDLVIKANGKNFVYEG